MFVLFKIRTLIMKINLYLNLYFFLISKKNTIFYMKTKLIIGNIILYKKNKIIMITIQYMILLKIHPSKFFTYFKF